MSESKIRKDWLERVKMNRFLALSSMFGMDNVIHELCKMADSNSFAKDLVKFASNVKEEEKPLNNKETFNGTSYSNTAPGSRKVITEGKTKGKVKVSKFDREVKIAKMYAPKRIVIGEVYVPYDPSDPDTVDTHRHAALAEDIEKAAYRFMEEMNLKNIDQQHNFVSGYGYVVESYIAKEGDPNFKPGSWIIGVKVTDDEVWTKIEKGEITGFSLAGSAVLEDPDKYVA